MYKYIFALLISAAPLLSFAQDQQEEHDHGCPVSRSERIVCGKMMCDFGLIMGEYPSECFGYERDFALLRARLRPFERLPRCYKRDENCNRAGRAGRETMDVTYCMDNADTQNDREICLNAITEAEENYCENLDDDIERRACEEIKSNGRLTDEFCDKTAIDEAGIRISRRNRRPGLLPTNPYWFRLSVEDRALYEQYFSECMALDAN